MYAGGLLGDSRVVSGDTVVDIYLGNNTTEQHSLSPKMYQRGGSVTVMRESGEAIAEGRM